MRSNKHAGGKGGGTFYQALLCLQSEEEMARFLHDLCTPAELRAMQERWAVAQCLESGSASYREISQDLGVSTTTVGRVARFLNEENNQGYRLVLARMKEV